MNAGFVSAPKLTESATTAESTTQQARRVSGELGSVVDTAATTLTAGLPGAMAVRAYLQLQSLKKAPPEVNSGN